MSEPKPGKDTSEFKLAKQAQILNMVATILLPIVGVVATHVANIESIWGLVLGGALAGITAMLNSWKSNTYTKKRTELKLEAAKENGAGGRE